MMEVVSEVLGYDHKGYEYLYLVLLINTFLYQRIEFVNLLIKL